MIKFLILLLFPALTYAAFSVSSNDFETVRQRSIDHKNSEVGDGYIRMEFEPYFESHFQEVMHYCFESVDIPEFETFEVIVQVGETGEIQASWLSPYTNVGSCLSNELKHSQFPKPPFSPFYASIVMHVTD